LLRARSLRRWFHAHMRQLLNLICTLKHNMIANHITKISDTLRTTQQQLEINTRNVTLQTE
uniref:Envelope glycoprotein n=1 Tax=Brugia timori TaxID=42155 RepID=A0A0R3QE70_9BILA